MPLGTVDRSPPPLFQQGASALTKFAISAALALFLMVADTRLNITQPLRAALAMAVHPVQRALLSPVDAWEGLGNYMRGMQSATAAEALARHQLVLQAERLSRTAQLQAENDQLRKLLDLRQAQPVHSLAAEVLYESADPFSRRVVIDQGSAAGVKPGAPVINDAGVLGQVTRVYLLSAEVTLLSDKDAAIPVLNTRTQQRGVAYGGEHGDGPMELRFMAANADIKPGDLLATSGLDGVYPPGLPVAKVTDVARRGDSSFAHVTLAPTAQIDAARDVLVLAPFAAQEAARAEAAAAAAADAASAAERQAEQRAEAKAARAAKNAERKAKEADKNSNAGGAR